MLAIEANDERLVGPSDINQKSMALSARAIREGSLSNQDEEVELIAA